MRRAVKALSAMVFFVLGAFVFCAADIIVLKDDQKFEADVKSFDAFYLNVVFPNGKEVTIPWNEVRYIKHTTTASSWLEETYMTNDDVEVKTLVSPLDPCLAMQKAIFPGIILKGAGHFYAKDSNAGMSLLSAGIVSAVIMAISVVEIITPQRQDQTLDVSKAVFYTGLTIFSASWLYDIVFAPGAAKKFNEKNTFLTEEWKKDENSAGE
ncbi:MAG TPA: hypothetical protein ENN43_08645 [bacterium]|nr:hypothetical protein [bacterium]